ncbi:hypothetical protein O6H91_07G091200 [Diphasiastrum complanatum]|uniref:Uncharacterized protein n=1 Tax=Diphasiastrum complanatum TaxID=34168 RepID=A0ACC2D7V3_DIPCM|nr:hypothetical protein O6H91_07G091200 [Diphasiastrum complanatum]
MSTIQVQAVKATGIGLPRDCTQQENEGDSEEVSALSSGSDYEDGPFEDSENESDACDSRNHRQKKCSAVDQVLWSELSSVIAEAGDLKKLKLDHYKAYLRKYGLRLTGVKAVLLDRIQEHLDIKNGQGEAKYKRSDFSIKCTGDVCQGDVILFEQKVYEKFDIASRSARGTCLGKRLVAGRVVKESYGAAKQQHTFTIEILWSCGPKKLPPMHPLLVKGRNLYRLETYRKPWVNEAERKAILDEKHARGNVARAMRAAAKTGFTSRPALKPITNGVIEDTRSKISYLLKEKAAEQACSQRSFICNGNETGALHFGPTALSAYNTLKGSTPNVLFQSYTVQNVLHPIQASSSSSISLVGAELVCPSCRNPAARQCTSRLCYHCCKESGKSCERHIERQMGRFNLR